MDSFDLICKQLPTDPATGSHFAFARHFYPPLGGYGSALRSTRLPTTSYRVTVWALQQCTGASWSEHHQAIVEWSLGVQSRHCDCSLHPLCLQLSKARRLFYCLARGDGAARGTRQQNCQSQCSIGSPNGVAQPQLEQPLKCASHSVTTLGWDLCHLFRSNPLARPSIAMWRALVDPGLAMKQARRCSRCCSCCCCWPNCWLYLHPRPCSGDRLLERSD